MLFSHLHLSFLSDLFLSGFQTKILCSFLIFPMRVSFTAHILRDIKLIVLDEGPKLWSSSLCSLLQPPATSSIWCPNMLLSSILFSNTVYLCSPLKVRNQVSYPDQTTVKNTGVHIFVCLDVRRERESVCVYTHTAR